MLAKLFGSTPFAPFRTMEDQLSGFMTFNPTSNGRKEDIEDDFLSIIQQAYKKSGPLFACVLARGMPFSEARFMFQEMIDGRPGRLSGDDALQLLENPWTNATTGEMLWRMEQMASLAGNFYATTVIGKRTKQRRIRVLRPDWVSILSGVYGDPDASAWDLNAEVLGYFYAPTGDSFQDPVFISPENMIHYSPIPDPNAQWRGMSWITPLVEEILGDKYAQRHKTKFFENGGTTNTAIVYDASVSVDKVKQFKKLFDEGHVGVENAYKVLHIGGGADAKALGFDMKAMDFRELQGSAETRIAAAAGVGSIIARFSEGMAGSSLNSGNYNSAKRQYADMTLRPLWRIASASLSKPKIVVVPEQHRLWYDIRDVEFLKEDRKDAAEIQQTNATTIRTLIDAGFEPAAVIDAVEAGDLSRLEKKHSGLFSVQLQAPGSIQPATEAVPPQPAPPAAT